MAPTSSSFACAVAAAAPLEGTTLNPSAWAVWSSGLAASPATLNARARADVGAPAQLIVMIEPTGVSTTLCFEQMAARCPASPPKAKANRVTSVL